jgi:2,5-diketo-D-gluconate reductase B
VASVEANGARIPAVGLGTWQLTGETARRAVEAALATGYRHIDTAQAYGNEREVGQAIRASAIPRDEMFLTTKVWWDRFRAGDLQRSAEESLRRLAVDAVDLLLLHWPNPEVPLEETLQALCEVKRRGMARHIGVSNFPVALIEQAVRISPEKLVTNQVEYHPFLDQSPVLAACRTHGMALTAYSPLARGEVFRSEVLKAIAQERGKTPSQIVIRWLIQQEGVVAIPRSSSPEHGRANFDVFDFELGAEEMQRIAGRARPDGRMVDPDFAPDWDMPGQAARSR